jgi:O-succinylbenzoate synthase
MAAGLALAGALPELDFACGLGTLSLLDGDVTTDSLLPVDGWLPVPARAPEPDRFAGFAADEETTARWLARLDRVRGVS